MGVDRFQKVLSDDNISNCIKSSCTNSFLLSDITNRLSLRNVDDIDKKHGTTFCMRRTR